MFMNIIEPQSCGHLASISKAAMLHAERLSRKWQDGRVSTAAASAVSARRFVAPTSAEFSICRRTHARSPATAATWSGVSCSLSCAFTSAVAFNKLAAASCKPCLQAKCIGLPLKSKRQSTSAMAWQSTSTIWPAWEDAGGHIKRRLA